MAEDPIHAGLGDNDMLARVEEAIIGMTPGETKSIVVRAADAFGSHEPNLIHRFERHRIPSEIDIKTGTKLCATDSGGTAIDLVIVDFTGTTVTVDGNHPLAGLDLTFELELIEIVN